MSKISEPHDEKPGQFPKFVADSGPANWGHEGSPWDLIQPPQLPQLPQLLPQSRVGLVFLFHPYFEFSFRSN